MEVEVVVVVVAVAARRTWPSVRGTASTFAHELSVISTHAPSPPHAFASSRTSAVSPFDICFTASESAPSTAQPPHASRSAASSYDPTISGASAVNDPRASSLPAAGRAPGPPGARTT